VPITGARDSSMMDDPSTHATKDTAMQLAPIALHTPSVIAAGPRFTGGIQYTGTSEKFSAFAARAKGGAYGDAEGYASLTQAIDALTLFTAGVHMPAAGVFERNGRFYGRQLENQVTFASSGASWTGMWRLEQHPSDAQLLTGTAPGEISRADALRAVVDGAQRIDVTHLPVADKK